MHRNSTMAAVPAWPAGFILSATPSRALAPLAVFLAGNAFLIFLLLTRLIHPDRAVRLLYDGNTLVFPPFLIAAAAWAGRFAHLRRLATVWLFAACLLVSIRVYATHIEPWNLQVREVTITTPRITRPFTVLHISDIQSAGIGDYESTVFSRIRALHPDLILHTGDLLQPTRGRTLKSEGPKLAELFATLSPPLGMFSVEGESDTTLAKVQPQFLGGMRFLNDEALELNVEGIHIRLLGLTLRDSRRHRGPAPSPVDNWLDGSPQDAVTIVMGHRPEYIADLLDKPIDLCLAGHTHGGQVRLPFYGALTTACSAPREWSRGYREEGRTRINVSAGIGASHNKGLPSIRINCPPEMTLFHFEPAS